MLVGSWASFVSNTYRAPDGGNFSTSSADVMLFVALTCCICLFVCCQLVEFHELRKVLLAKLKKIEPHLPADGQGGVTILPVEALLHRPAALLRHELLDLLNGIRLEVIQPLLDNRDQILAKTKMRKIEFKSGFIQLNYTYLNIVHGCLGALQ